MTLSRSVAEAGVGGERQPVVFDQPPERFDAVEVRAVGR